MKFTINPFTQRFDAVGTSGGVGSGTLQNIKEDNVVVVANATDLNFTEPDAVLVTASGSQANVDMRKYLLLAGRAGGQTAFGGTGATDELTMGPTSSIPAGIHIQPNGIGQNRLLLGDGNDPTVVFVPGGLMQMTITADQNLTGSPAVIGIYSLNGGLANSATFLGIGANGTFASPTASVDGDNLFSLKGLGLDSTNTLAANPAAGFIVWAVDGTPSPGVVPGQLILSTTDQNGAGSSRIWIRRNGLLGIGDDFHDTIARLHVRNEDAATVASIFQGFFSQTADLTQWSNRIQGSVSNTIGGNPGDTTITLVDSTAFAPSGVIYVGDSNHPADPLYIQHPYAYSANNTGTGVLTLVGTVQFTFSPGAIVYQMNTMTHVDANGNLLFVGGDVNGARGFIEIGEFDSTTPTNDAPAPAVGKYRIYARDNGSGKTQAVIRFATGAPQVIATQP